MYFYSLQIVAPRDQQPIGAASYCQLSIFIPPLESMTTSRYHSEFCFRCWCTIISYIGRIYVIVQKENYDFHSQIAFRVQVLLCIVILLSPFSSTDENAYYS